MSFVNDYLGGVSLLVVVVGPGSGLKRTDNADGAALVEVTGNEFCSLSPRNNVDKISGGLTEEERIVFYRSLAIISNSLDAVAARYEG